MVIKQKLKSRLVLLLKLCIAIALYAFILKNVDWTRLPSIIAQSNLFLISLVVWIMILNILLCALKWKILLSIHAVHFHFNQLSKWYFITFFFNNFFPSTLGGDGYRFFKTRNNPRSQACAAIAILMERMTGLFALLILAFIGGILAYLKLQDQLSLASVAIGFSGMCLFIIFFASISHQWFHSRTWIPEKIKRFLEHREDYRINNEKFVLVLILSVAYQLFIVISRLLLVYSVGEDIPFSLMIVTTVISVIIGLIPITINGLGVMDGSFVFLLAYYGVNYDHAVIVTLLVRFLQVPFSLFGGILYMFDKDSLKAEKL